MGRDRAWLVVAALTAAGAALRVGPTFEFWLNADEGLYDYIAHAPFELARVPMAHNAHPPGYFWLLRGVACLGDGFLWLRVPSLLAGIATIPVMYRLGEEVAGRVGGTTAAAMTALSPAAIALSEVARQYAILGLLLASATLFFLRFLRTRRRRDLGAYAGSLLAALLVQYGSVVLPAAVAAATAVGLATRRVDRATAAAIAVAHVPVIAVGVLLYALQVQPNLMGQPMQREAIERWLSASFARSPAGVFHSFVALFEYLAGPRFGIAAATAFACGLGACVALRRGDVAALVVSGLAVAVGLSVAGLYPFGGTRHSFHLAPLVALPLAVGAGWLAERPLPVPAALAALLAVLVGATGPIGAWPGLFGPRTAPAPELVIDRREVGALAPVLGALLRSPGIAVTDLQTIYTLSPLMRAVGAWPRWFGAPPIAVYRYGAELVVVAPVWQVRPGAASRHSPGQLDALLRRVEAEVPGAAERLAAGVTVITTDEGRLREAISTAQAGRAAAEAPVREIAQSPHVSVFRLDVSAYRAGLDPRRRASRRSGS